MAQSYRTLTIGESLGYQGGLEQFVFQVASVLKDRGHRHWLLYERTTGTDEESYGRVFEETALIPPGGDVAFYRKFLDELCARWKPDVALLHKTRNTAFMEALVERVPTITINQDHFIYCLREVRYFPVNRAICTLPLSWKCLAYGCFVGRPLRHGFIPKFQSLSARRKMLNAQRRAHRAMVLSEHMKSELVLNGFSPDKIDVVPGFTRIPEKEFPPVSDESNTILFLGQVIRSKGLDFLLRALKILKRPARLKVIGKGSALEANKALAEELGITDRVDFLGWVPHEALDKYFEEAAAVVVPSVWAEPFCLVGIESMARSRPVVAFKVGGIPQWLEDGKTGLLAREISPEALAESIDRLLGDRSLARKIGAYGRKRAIEEFSPQVAGERIESVIIKTITRNRGLSPITESERSEDS
jgi:glycosyltransferase involved in cell wall biosynthesis